MFTKIHPQSIVACLLYLMMITVQQDPSREHVDIDEIVSQCQSESTLNETLEAKYAQEEQEDRTLPKLDAFQNKLLLKRAYEISRRQRPFECIAERTKIYNMHEDGPSREEVESNPSYVGLQEMCMSQERHPTCNMMYPYRSFDGTCNNLENPNWGAILDCTKRLLPHFYEGVAGFRQSVEGGPLPNPRILSRELHSDMNRTSHNFTSLFAFFGQILDHDFADSPINSIDGTKLIMCCPIQKDSHPQCAPFAIADDSFYSTFNVTCFPIVRSAACATCSVDQRHQMSQATAYIDASVTYGSTNEDARDLRSRDGTGKLRKQMRKREKLLPADLEVYSESCGSSAREEFCFKAGDRRVNVNTPLMSLHTLFFREHNRVVEELARMNSMWDEETLYQESRKIVGSILQNIVYNEFLPPLLGEDIVRQYGLNVLEDGRTRYDPTIDPTILAEFNTVAFRLHSLISSVVSEFQLQDGRQLLRDLQFHSAPLYNGFLGPFVKGMAESPAQMFDRFVVTDVTNFLYKEINGSFGFDLPAVNIQRGRDHGIPPYVYLIEYASGGEIIIEDFDDLHAIMPSSSVEKLRRVYSDVHDIDPWVGVNLEIVEPPLLMGPTMSNIIAEQFMRLKYGDRFYFEHDLQELVFNDAQLASIRKSSIARIICDNTEVNTDPSAKIIQRMALLLPSSENPHVSCNEIPILDLTPWKASG